MNQAHAFKSLRRSRRAFARQSIAASMASLGFLRQLAHGQDKPLPTRVLVWCEGMAHKSVYPRGINGTLADDLNGRGGIIATTAGLDDAEAGLADEVLNGADVMIWWGRLRHDEVPDDRASAVAERVRAGQLGLVALHASFASKPFQRLMGQPCMPGAWREDGRPEHVAIQDPDHPIVRDVAPFVIPQASMYAEPFSVPEPESVFCMSSWETGETFRSGLTWTIGTGRVVYFRPGHDGFPVLFHPAVRQIIANAITWAAPRT